MVGRPRPFLCSLCFQAYGTSHTGRLPVDRLRVVRLVLDIVREGDMANRTLGGLQDATDLQESTMKRVLLSPGDGVAGPASESALSLLLLSSALHPRLAENQPFASTMAPEQIPFQSITSPNEAKTRTCT